MCYSRHMSSPSSDTRGPAPGPATPRSITSVDLGLLRARVDAASAAAGVGPSTWLRDLVRRELDVAAPPLPAAPPPAADKAAAAGPDPTSVYRAWLDAPLTAKLDQVTRGGGFRTRAAALRGLIEGVNVGAAGGVGMAEAVQALGFSNHHLVVIGRTLSGLAKDQPPPDANAGSPSTASHPSTAHPDPIAHTLHAIHQHLHLAAVLVGELRPMLKSQKDVP